MHKLKEALREFPQGFFRSEE